MKMEEDRIPFSKDDCKEDWDSDETNFEEYEGGDPDQEPQPGPSSEIRVFSDNPREGIEFVLASRRVGDKQNYYVCNVMGCEVETRFSGPAHYTKRHYNTTHHSDRQSFLEKKRPKNTESRRNLRKTKKERDVKEGVWRFCKYRMDYHCPYKTMVQHELDEHEWQHGNRPPGTYMVVTEADTLNQMTITVAVNGSDSRSGIYKGVSSQGRVRDGHFNENQSCQHSSICQDVILNPGKAAFVVQKVTYDTRMIADILLSPTDFAHAMEAKDQMLLFLALLFKSELRAKYKLLFTVETDTLLRYPTLCTQVLVEWNSFTDLLCTRHPCNSNLSRGVHITPEDINRDFKILPINRTPTLIQKVTDIVNKEEIAPKPIDYLVIVARRGITLDALLEHIRLGNEYWIYLGIGSHGSISRKHTSAKKCHHSGISKKVLASNGQLGAYRLLRRSATPTTLDGNLMSAYKTAEYIEGRWQTLFVLLKLFHPERVQNVELLCYAETQQIFKYEGLIPSLLAELEDFSTIICTIRGCTVNRATDTIPKLHFHRRDLVWDFKVINIPPSEKLEQDAAEKLIDDELYEQFLQRQQPQHT